MKTRKILISMASAAVMAFNTVSFDASALPSYSGNWRFTRYYDERGNIYIADLGYTGDKTELTIPKQFGIYPVKEFYLYNFFENDFEVYETPVTLHIPDGVKVYGINEFLDLYPDSPAVHLVYSNGVSETVKRNFIPNYGEWHINEKDWKYNILDSLEGVCDEPCAEIISYSGNDADIIIPPVLGGYPVVRVADTTFDVGITHERVSIAIPTSTYFHDSTGLRTDTMENNIQLADGCLNGFCNLSVFYGDCTYFSNYDCYISEKMRYHTECRNSGEYTWQLERIVYPQQDEKAEILPYIAGIPVTSVGENVLWSDSESDIELPDTITDISPYAFSGSSLRSITIPESVKILPKCCFEKCTSLKEIKGIENVPVISDEVFMEAAEYDLKRETYSDAEWFNLIDRDDMVHFNYIYNATDQSFIVTDMNNENSYRIKRNFDDNTLSAQLIYSPDRKTEIPDDFHGIPLTILIRDTIPKGAKLVVYEDKYELAYDDINFYHDDLFKGSRYKLEADEASYEEILSLDNTYQRNTIKEVEIQCKDITIKNRGLSGLRCSTLYFPESAHLGASFCSGNPMLKEISFGGFYPFITFDNRACDGMNFLEALVFPEKCADLRIGMYAFGNSGIKELVLPEGTSFVGSYAFQKNSKLESVTINDSPVISSHSFMQCPKLREVNIAGEPELDTDAFEDCTSLSGLNIKKLYEFKGSAFNGCINLKEINGEQLFENGKPKEEYKDFIEENFRNSDNNGIINDYVMYRVRQTVAETVDDSMTDLQKIKAIHDKVCTMVDYDTDNKSDLKNHTDVSIFLNKTSVCEGYARAMNLMLNEAGIETQYVRTDDHAWVIVRAGEHYFHVDATWDDDGDSISYDWFMKSDAQIDGKESHSDWKNDIPSELHKFQNTKLPECTSIMGDVDENGVVDAVDASAILKAYARFSIDGTRTIDKVLADYNFDGKVTAVDASLVLTDYAEKSVES